MTTEKTPTSEAEVRDPFVDNPNTATPPVTPPVAPPVEGAVPPPALGAGEGAVTPPVIPSPPPAERTYSKLEWDKRQSAIDKQTETTKKQVETLQENFDKLSGETEESKIATWLKSIEAAEGDVAQATIVANAQREVSKRARELEKTAQELANKLTLVNESEKREKARGLVKTHELGEEAFEELLGAESPPAMEVKALTMRIEKVSAEQTPPAQVPSGVAPVTGRDLSGLSLIERGGTALEMEDEKRR